MVFVFFPIPTAAFKSTTESDAPAPATPAFYIIISPSESGTFFLWVSLEIKTFDSLACVFIFVRIYLGMLISAASFGVVSVEFLSLFDSAKCCHSLTKAIAINHTVSSLCSLHSIRITNFQSIRYRLKRIQYMSAIMLWS